MQQTISLPTRSVAVWVTVEGMAASLGGVVLFGIAAQLAGVGVDFLPFAIFAYTAVGTLSLLVFFLPSNFGITEVGLSLLLTPFMPSSVAVLVAVLTRVLLITYTAIGCGAIVAATTMIRHTRTVRTEV